MGDTEPGSSCPTWRTAASCPVSVTQSSRAASEVLAAPDPDHPERPDPRCESGEAGAGWFQGRRSREALVAEAGERRKSPGGRRVPKSGSDRPFRQVLAAADIPI